MVQRFEDADGFVGYRSELLSEIGVPHVLTTRRGPQRELDAAHLDARSGARVALAAGLPNARIASARQVHGAGLIVVASDTPSGAEADALVTDHPDRLLLVRSADCVPLLLARGDGVRVAAVHAGWRGLVAGVIPRAVQAFEGAPLVALIGACLCREHFEVGPELAAAFVAAGLEESVDERAGARPHIDLRVAASIQLERCGVPRIDSCERCTWEDRELFSYRRDVTHGGLERTGSLAACIAPRASA